MAANKRVLFLGAAGLIGPHLIPGLADDYDLRLADVKSHPDGIDVDHVDVTDYEQVRDAARGMDAIMNFTVVRNDADQSFHVSTRGAWHVMRAAAELGIRKIVHSGPESVRGHYDHSFDINDPPLQPGPGYYMTTKMLSREICKAWSRAHDIQTICFLFNGLGAPPEGPVSGSDFPPFTIVWPDLHQACRLALEIESIQDNYQEFNLHSHLGQGKFSIDKARRMLGYEPLRNMADVYRRPI
ncbi:MAG TPA: NAD(P)-dependent oxidoreductase [Candidatus Latescibacteria bacterium]|jgi:nucleoside-diphosphate-sugar epimerase|nr:hypothetical protein [Gemmatimonadota bacterium]MDP7362945.1 NAD(P)-dependent oxidoreductase [Candidatus Latescibacterota bacterium]MDP7632924.1 NAD(P)-dependent oxidoreductase [Candidatus Latescibacterota bacterium]HCV26429.1 hypothetical protein [Candidatus Latescibacterota bacterium]HJN31122.1 NAD(P)-dependent oxidoreductase [Candidatus Latescibacterota bacterium]|tara:strand:- start:940 stop:1662 length:723 start_codon:yes stop_codon:yes gene_type:complete